MKVILEIDLFFVSFLGGTRACANALFGMASWREKKVNSKCRTSNSGIQQKSAIYIFEHPFKRNKNQPPHLDYFRLLWMTESRKDFFGQNYQLQRLLNVFDNWRTRSNDCNWIVQHIELAKLARCFLSWSIRTESNEFRPFWRIASKRWFKNLEQICALCLAYSG